MTDVEALEAIEYIIKYGEAISPDGRVQVTETEYEPPFAGIWVTMADGSRWIVCIEPQATQETP
jgi:hypothetical protein